MSPHLEGVAGKPVGVRVPPGGQFFPACRITFSRPMISSGPYRFFDMASPPRIRSMSITANRTDFRGEGQDNN
jgi:hypothetical protein